MTFSIDDPESGLQQPPPLLKICLEKTLRRTRVKRPWWILQLTPQNGFLMSTGSNITTKSCMGAYPKYQTRQEIGDYALQDIEEPISKLLRGELREATSYFVKLVDWRLPTQTYFSKIQDWKHQKWKQPWWTGVCGLRGPSQFERKSRLNT